MAKIAELRDDLHQYLADHGLMKKWLKARTLFENDPFHLLGLGSFSRIDTHPFCAIQR